MAQILGAFIASALVYNQWKVLIEEGEAKLLGLGPAVFASTQFTPSGPGGIFAFYLLPGQTIPRVFLNEFVNVSDTFFFPKSQRRIGEVVNSFVLALFFFD